LNIKQITSIFQGEKEIIWQGKERINQLRIHEDQIWMVEEKTANIRVLNLTNVRFLYCFLSSFLTI